MVRSSALDVRRRARVCNGRWALHPEFRFNIAMPLTLQMVVASTVVIAPESLAEAGDSSSVLAAAVTATFAAESSMPVAERFMELGPHSSEIPTGVEMLILPAASMLTVAGPRLMVTGPAAS